MLGKFKNAFPHLSTKIQEMNKLENNLANYGKTNIKKWIAGDKQSASSSAFVVWEHPIIRSAISHIPEVKAFANGGHESLVPLMTCFTSGCNRLNLGSE
jgi:hypothetical protein